MSIYHISNRYASITAYYALSLTAFDMQTHTHASCEIMYVDRGSCHVFLKEEELLLTDNQFVFLDAGHPHRLLIDAGTPCSILNVEFSAVQGKTFLDLNYPLSFDRNYKQFLQKKLPAAAATDNSSLGFSLKDLISQLQKKQTDNEYLIRLLFFRMLAELSCNFSQTARPTGTHYIKNACAYIQSHLTETLSVPELAAHAGINRSYLQALFSRHLHCTITDYVNQKRLEKAAYLLTNSSLSITDVAFHSGYNSRQYFGCAFEKYHKMSPRSYRQLHGRPLSPSTGVSQYLLLENGEIALTPLLPPSS